MGGLKEVAKKESVGVRSDEDSGSCQDGSERSKSSAGLWNSQVIASMSHGCPRLSFL